MNNIQIFLGSQGIKDAYQQSLKSKNLDIQCLSKNYQEIIGDFFEKEHSHKLYNGNIKIREIIFGKGFNTNKKHYIPNKNETDMIIGDNFTTLVSFNNQNPYAITFKDKEMVKMFKSLFETRWNQ